MPRPAARRAGQEGHAGDCSVGRSLSVCASITSNFVGPYASSTHCTALDVRQVVVALERALGASAATAAR